MYHLLLNTPFGFAFELQNEGCYFSGSSYQLYLNGEFYGTYKENVISLYGLQPDKLYQVKLSGDNKEYKFEIKTQPLKYLIHIKDYNATGDGETDDTSAINTAIYTAPKGAVVYIPKGNYSVNQIYLKSGVDIYLEKGSCIKQNTRRDELSILKGYQKDYHHADAAVNASWEGNPLDTYCSVFYGKDVENIRIFGEGIIDGSGKEGSWWVNPKQKNIAFRPNNIFLNKCSDIVVAGITSRNSACWNIHPFYCDRVKFYGLQVQSSADSPNTDGINPESCDEVEIAGCLFDVGDDCVAVKSGKYFMSQYERRPCCNIMIRNCYMGSGHGGLAVGSEISSGVDGVSLIKCHMEGTDRGVRIKTRRGRGKFSIVRNVTIENVVMNGVHHCIGINMFYNCDPDGSSDYVKSKTIMKKDDQTPSIRNIFVSNIRATDVKGCCIFLYGLPESRIEDVAVVDSSIHFADERILESPELLDDFTPIPNLGFFIKNTKRVHISNNKIVGEHVKVVDEEENNE